MIEIEIVNQDGTTYFELDQNLYEFTYESFEKMIDFILSKNESINVKCDDADSVEYKNLLESIITGVQSEDFKSAVKNVKENTLELEKLEKL